MREGQLVQQRRGKARRGIGIRTHPGKPRLGLRVPAPGFDLVELVDVGGREGASCIQFSGNAGARIAMSIPYYVSPEQLMQDKAEYAKKGIAKGRSIIAMEYVDGVLFVADNPNSSLFKISEIYDTIAFSGAGKYSEFENLRKAGIQHADLKGFMYSRQDVMARSLANGYSQTLGTIFSQEQKPFEVEILLAQVGEELDQNELYRISFDGTIFQEHSFVVIGGRSEAILASIRQGYGKTLPDLPSAFSQCVRSLRTATDHDVSVEGLEVAVLNRQQVGRKFSRIPYASLPELKD